MTSLLCARLRVTSLLTLLACGETSHGLLDAGATSDARAQSEDGSATGADGDAPAGDSAADSAAELDASPVPSDASLDLTRLCSDAAVDAAAVDVSCEADQDCDAVFYNLDCCGTQAVTGVNRQDSQRAQELASECGRGQAVCDCLAGPGRADDGTKETMDFPLRLACVEHRCVSTYRVASRTACGDDGGTCDADSEICVIGQGWSLTYKCKQLPDACRNERSCSCDAGDFCAGEVGNACSDFRPNTLACACLGC